jgi:hypothetical protein
MIVASLPSVSWRPNDTATNPSLRQPSHRSTVGNQAPPPRIPPQALIGAPPAAVHARSLPARRRGPARRIAPAGSAALPRSAARAPTPRAAVAAAAAACDSLPPRAAAAAAGCAAGHRRRCGCRATGSSGRAPTRVRGVSIFLDKNRSDIGKSQPKRPPNRTQRTPHQHRAGRREQPRAAARHEGVIDEGVIEPPFRGGKREERAESLEGGLKRRGNERTTPAGRADNATNSRECYGCGRRSWDRSSEEVTEISPRFHIVAIP